MLRSVLRPRLPRVRRARSMSTGRIAGTRRKGASSDAARRVLDEDRHVGAMLHQRDPAAPGRAPTLYERMSGQEARPHDLRGGYRRTGEATPEGTPLLEAEERPGDDNADALALNSTADGISLGGAADGGAVDANSVLEARAHAAVRNVVKNAPNGVPLTVDLEDDLSRLEDFDWDVEAAAAQRIHEHLALEESRLKEESEAIDQFLQSDWHMTLSKLQDRQVRKIWHEFHTSGQPLDSVTYDRLMHRYDESCEAVHHEWMRNSDHMSWRELHDWKNPVWEKSRRNIRESRQRQSETAASVESVVRAEGAPGLERVARQQGAEAPAARRQRAGAGAGPALGSRGAAAAVERGGVESVAVARGQGAEEEAPALAATAWGQEDIGAELQAEFAAPARRRRRRRDYRVD